MEDKPEKERKREQTRYFREVYVYRYFLMELVVKSTQSTQPSRVVAKEQGRRKC